MGQVFIGINTEYARHSDKTFEWSIEQAAAMGYDYVEPWVHWGRELTSEAGFFMSVSMLDDPFGYAALVRKRVSSFQRYHRIVRFVSRR